MLRLGLRLLLILALGLLLHRLFLLEMLQSVEAILLRLLPLSRGEVLLLLMAHELLLSTSILACIVLLRVGSLLIVRLRLLVRLLLLTIVKLLRVLSLLCLRRRILLHLPHTELLLASVVHLRLWDRVRTSILLKLLLTWLI